MITSMDNLVKVRNSMKTHTTMFKEIEQARYERRRAHSKEEFESDLRTYSKKLDEEQREKDKLHKKIDHLLDDDDWN